MSTKWENVNCGSSVSRDVFNSSLKKALADFGKTGARQRVAMFGPNTDFVATPRMSPKSFEMVALSSGDADAAPIANKLENRRPAE